MLLLDYPAKRPRLCLDTYVIRDRDCFSRSCKAANLPEKLRTAWRAGFSEVELWHPDVQAYANQHGLNNLRSKITDLGLRVPSYKVASGWMEATPEHYRHIKEECKAILETAAEVGAQSVVMKMVSHEHMGPPPPEGRSSDRYRDLLEIAAPLGLRPALEFMSTARSWNTFQSMIKLARSVQHPLSSVVLDTFHLWRSDGDENFQKFEREAYELNGRSVSVIHLTDTDPHTPREKQSDGHRRMPGRGRLNLRHFLRIVSKLGCRASISLNVYDVNLWNYPNLQIATEGMNSLLALVNEFSHLRDGPQWAGRQTERCLGLWLSGNRHLDPRLETNNRAEQLEKHLRGVLVGKKVLDFKCGFSPLGEYVDIGFDAHRPCIEYLRKVHPHGNWMVAEDAQFAEWFNEPIDTLMHLGLGDSDTEMDSHLKLRVKCKPSWVVLECCGTPDGRADESKPGAAERWRRLKEGLTGQEIVLRTNMSNRSNRLLFVGQT